MAYESINHTRHQKLFELAPTPSLLTNVSKIVSMVSKRLECIAESDIATDHTLAEAARRLQLNTCEMLV